ncbi:hypothetical protein [Mucilaginibacter sp. PAMB04168]|uniref:hypothetical protein n=1 Tax=Mucilaginibacter sp. PAMB04168 TaxID=3138567 RepID=UPI0031F6B46F
MKIYSSEQLAVNVMANAHRKYPDANGIYEKFKTGLKRKAQALISQKLLPVELESKGRVLASMAYSQFRRFPAEAIELNLSRALLNEAERSGINLEDHQAYFDGIADDMVKAAIKQIYKPYKDEVNKFKSKLRKR